MFWSRGRFGLGAVLGGSAALVSPGANWWLQVFGEPGASTSAMDLLSFLGKTVYPPDGVWQVLNVDSLLSRVSSLYPPAWGDIIQLVVGGLVTTFSIMILLAIITWGLGKAAPRLAPAGQGADKKKGASGGQKAAPKGADL